MNTQNDIVTMRARDNEGSDYMKATRTWTCQCGCDEKIQPGENMRIEGGMIYREEHSTGDLFEGERREIVKPKRKIQQRPLYDLPLFSKAEHVQQIALF